MKLQAGFEPEEDGEDVQSSLRSASDKMLSAIYALKNALMLINP